MIQFIWRKICFNIIRYGQVKEFIEETIGWMENETENIENIQINRFNKKFTKDANNILNSWFKIENLNEEHQKWLKILGDG